MKQTQRLHPLPLDILTLIFIGINLLAILASWSYMETPVTIFAVYLSFGFISLIFTAIDRLPSWQNSASGIKRHIARIFTLFRIGYPLIFMLFFFVGVTEFQHLFFPEMLDPYFIAFDEALFGYQPVTEWMQRYDNYWISEILHGAYFIYYILLGLLPIGLFLKDPAKLEKYLFALMFVFFFTAITYLIFPVAGGRYNPEIRELTETLRHGPFTKLMALTYQASIHFGAAFPSTHVIMSLVLVAGSWQYFRKLSPIFIINAVLVIIGTVYCGYHYVADVLGGILYFLMFYPLGLKLFTVLKAQRPGLSLKSDPSLRQPTSF